MRYFTTIIVAVQLFKKILNTSLCGNNINGEMYTSGAENQTTVVIL